jgi:hypothetical protein
MIALTRTAAAGRGLVRGRAALAVGRGRQVKSRPRIADDEQRMQFGPPPLSDAERRRLAERPPAPSAPQPAQQFAQFPPQFQLNRPPKSNAERQRDFRRNHPGYDRRRKAQERARVKQMVKHRLRQESLLAEQAAVAHEAAVRAMLMPIKPQLLLPAPVRDLLMEEMDALRAKLAARRSAELVPLSRPAQASSHAARAA